jgi:lipopolysaccharide transport system permease protein
MNISAADQRSDPLRHIDTSAPTVVIESQSGIFDFGLRYLWQYRELLYFLVWRDIKVRYKQTALGAAWAVLQPLVMMAMFTIVFSRFAKIPSDGFPYPLFVFAALLPWTLFADSLSRSSLSVVNDANLIKKIYFPRLLIPISNVLVPLVDFVCAFGIMFVMLLWFGVLPTARLLAIPIFLLLALATSFGVSLWLSALNVKYRDVKQTIPFVSQIWFYASPVIYPISMVPEAWRHLYSLNPMTGVVEGFRWALLGGNNPDVEAMGISSVITLLILIGGLMYFRRMERTFADVI